MTHWIGRLNDARFLLVQKVGAGWTVFEGARDDVLATVPDEHMESVTQAVVAMTTTPRR